MPSPADLWKHSVTRRAAVRSFSAFLAASPLLRAQQDPFRPHPRVAGLDEIEDVFGFEEVAFAKLPRAAFDYTAYGTESEFTLRRNREAFDWVSLVPGVSRAAAAPDTSLELFGTRLSSPILISPTAAQVAIHPDGEAAMHQGATKANTPMIVSNVASLPLAKIAEAANGPLWFQLYPKREAEANRSAMEDAINVGCKAVVVTVDQQASVFERALHDRNLGSTGGPPRRSTRGAPGNPYRVEEMRIWYHWGLFDEIRKATRAPLIIKGVLTAEDANMAIERGADGIYVSNHGGRALDYSPSTLEVLPEIVDAVRRRVPVLFDSGIRRGEDILKAMALGATAVCLGRVPRWGLGAYGAPGVQRALELLQREFAAALAATGRPALASIDRSLVRTDFA